MKWKPLAKYVLWGNISMRAFTGVALWSDKRSWAEEKRFPLSSSLVVEIALVILQQNRETESCKLFKAGTEPRAIVRYNWMRKAESNEMTVGTGTGSIPCTLSVQLLSSFLSALQCRYRLQFLSHTQFCIGVTPVTSVQLLQTHATKRRENQAGAELAHMKPKQSAEHKYILEAALPYGMAAYSTDSLLYQFCTWISLWLWGFSGMRARHFRKPGFKSGS